MVTVVSEELEAVKHSSVAVWLLYFSVAKAGKRKVQKEQLRALEYYEGS